MNYEEVTFEDFMSLPSGERKRILNDPDLLKLLVKKKLNPSRYSHSLSVASLCRELAVCHHVDPEKAYLAGLLHDVCKGLEKTNITFLEDYLRYYDHDKLNGIYGAYHAWSARYYLKEMLNFHDKDILNAIYNHTICNSRDKLSLILYIADKREPLRGIKDDIIKIARKDLYQAFKILSWDVEKYIREVKNERFIENRI
ncbi:MAG: bis(5'-nucleosyl)-tetraphosphatase (symmetrical) YqeK [Erysipelotrichaceae bacterium]|nr:bis(5'-nucleosyl)-tetraphosphatase (symmetrical) YqeK [Erysipelotrichaceae bacterium]